jgi:inner membrane protein
MTALIDALSSYGLLSWFMLAVLLLVLDFVIPGVHFLWFGLAAAATGAIAWLLGSTGMAIGWPLQLLLFGVLSVLTLFLVKGLGLNSPGNTSDPYLNVRGAEFIGRSVVVDEAIMNGRGRVIAGDGVWPAEGEDAPKGATVLVTGVNGASLVVENSREVD